MKIQGLIEEIEAGEFPVKVSIDDLQTNGLLLNFAPEINLVLSKDKVNGVFFLRVFSDMTRPLDADEELLFTSNGIKVVGYEVR